MESKSTAKPYITIRTTVTNEPSVTKEIADVTNATYITESETSTESTTKRSEIHLETTYASTLVTQHTITPYVVKPAITSVIKPATMVSIKEPEIPSSLTNSATIASIKEPKITTSLTNPETSIAKPATIASTTEPLITKPIAESAKTFKIIPVISTLEPQAHTITEPAIITTLSLTRDMKTISTVTKLPITTAPTEYETAITTSNIQKVVINIS